MNVLLVQVDGKMPNLALMKLSRWHKAEGDKVGFEISEPDLIYVSVIFKRNKVKVGGIGRLYPNADVKYGGPGYNLQIKLPDEVEFLMPDYSIYPQMDFSIGFTTRGCIRKCYFCIVPQKEGRLVRWQHPQTFHNPQFKKMVLLDNNLLADRDWFFEITDWIIENKISIDITQGLDIRLLDGEIAEHLTKLKWSRPIHFAYDNESDQDAVHSGIRLLRDVDIDIRHDVQFYVYIDGPDQFESGANRCAELKALGTNAFVQYNIDRRPTPEIKSLQRWANRKRLYWSCSFDTYNRRLNRLGITPTDKPDLKASVLEDIHVH